MDIDRMLNVLSSLDSDEFKCPHCDNKNSAQDCPDLVTYHGDGEPVGYTCTTCDEDFFVHEEVRRCYDVSKDGTQD